MLTKDYIAGFIDADGCITIRKAKPSGKSKSPCYLPVVYIVNTKIKVLKEIQKVYGGNIYKKKRFNYNSKPIYSLNLDGFSKAFPILQDLAKRLFIKKHIVKKVLEYKKFFGSKSYKKGNQFSGNRTVPQNILQKRNEIYIWCKKNNKRGI